MGTGHPGISSGWNLLQAKFSKHCSQCTPRIIFCWQTSLMNPAHAVCDTERGGGEERSKGRLW